ncbi:hypothetical protein NPIL_594201 [Nephila pilipes]|uniref:Uncharacterized protein n=1 Tax=Nephila pilipes TaxID=299642 RepID=A0A8X6T8B8_NEPPI|nr:hypothetical protein NPIL_594201 [Nephila pilipes]
MNRNSKDNFKGQREAVARIERRLKYIATKMGIKDVSGKTIQSLKKAITGSEDYKENDIKESLVVATKRREEA